MGRELKRVPLDFNWPIDKVWKGFLNPNVGRSTCPDCSYGSTWAKARLDDLVSLLMLSGEDARRGDFHPYFADMALHHTRRKVPSKDMIELTQGLAGRKMSFIGHDCCDQWSASRKIIAAAGLPKYWGTCKTCGGDGCIWDTPEHKKQSEDWTNKEPPEGFGYQLWETVSEGSPITPVFAKPEELAQWLVGHDTSITKGLSYEQWMKFILGDGWAPSLVVANGKIMNGVEAASEIE